MSDDRSETLEEQADKEFVWSLWKRLQVANPDLTQAVSLVVEREKHKAEMRDRKVLEILQFKDQMIEELEQLWFTLSNNYKGKNKRNRNFLFEKKVVAQQQEMNSLAQKRTAADDQSALMKELTALREQMVNNSQELKELKMERRRKEEEERQVVLALEKEKEGLTSCCATLRADLEEKERQANRQQEQISAAQTKVKQLEAELHNSWQQLSSMQSHCSDLEDQLSSKEKEAAAKDAQLSQLRHDYADVQTLYRQSAGHTAEQSQLIKQLEGLNLDTQKVLRNQEEAHTADTSSYQRLKGSAADGSRASGSAITNLAPYGTACRILTNESDECQTSSPKNLIVFAPLKDQIPGLQIRPFIVDPLVPSEDSVFSIAHSVKVNVMGRRGAPDKKNLYVVFSYSFFKAGFHSRCVLIAVNKSVSNKPNSAHPTTIEENEELRKAHDNRRERICVIKTNYKTVRDQLRELEKSHFLDVHPPTGPPGHDWGRVQQKTETDGQGWSRESYSCSLLSSKEAPARVSNRTQPSGYTQDHEQHESWEHGTKGVKRRWRRKRMLMKAQHCSSSLQQRIESQRRHIDVLRSAKEDAVLSAKELHRANERIREQLSSLTEKLSSSKQLTQKLTSDLAATEQQKKVLEMELKQWRQSAFPQQPAPTVSVTAECCCQAQAGSALAHAASQTLEAEVKQLQAKVKSTSAEVTKQVAANKALRGQLQEKEDKLRQLQEKASHAERDANMKRQLVEDLKTRLKFLQEMEKSYRGQVEDLEKKDQRVQTLLARLGASEKALAELEKTATDKMEGLAQQSSSALDKLQRQLSQASSQLEQFHFFIKGGLSAKSVIRAKSIAASILNMSENDLADIMDTDQVRVNMSYKHYISETITEKTGMAVIDYLSCNI
ncbi:unnamed protein product [Tetraodon nigroviridis]|uniref:(spotted green pufferfish) hypothetical protein n=1 Tax=Tetraodon nigroviridis TaxID=99883 RepID=Q4SBQ7_TETNG|nr:unnamed protein product [Tetraodon nigroviridis]